MNSTSIAPAQLPDEIFKAYDIRGIVGSTLSTEIAEWIGQAIGSEALDRGSQSIVVGRDGRLSGPDLVAALCRGLAKTGIDVIDIGRVPTPVIYFAAHHLQTHSCISVTGSHNPPDYNGFKIVLAGETLSGDAIKSLRQRCLQGRLRQGSGQYVQKDVREDYLQRICSDVTLKRKLRVAVDCGNGVAGELAPVLLRRLGCEVVELFCDIDGNFPNHHPDPSQPKNLEDLIKVLVENPDLDIGLAFDGDGDRLGVITPAGKVVWPDRQMILFAQDILSRHPGAEIIYDVKCSRNLPKAISVAGGKPTIWKTGHSFIKAKLKESGALLAGEMSGHLFFKERWYGFDDGLYAAARLLELLAKTQQTADEVFNALPDSINTPELQIAFKEGEHYLAIERLREAARFDDAEVSTIDGLRVDFEDGFGLVRASNTTPVLVLRFEGDTVQALKKIQKRFADLIRSVVPNVNLPF
jgi:phosphomannomutase/phosphoglucomutase